MCIRDSIELVKHVYKNSDVTVRYLAQPLMFSGPSIKRERKTDSDRRKPLFFVVVARSVFEETRKNHWTQSAQVPVSLLIAGYC